MNQLRTIPLNTTQFDCIVYDEAGEPTGQTETYFLEELVSIARFRQMQKFQREVATGLTHFDLIQLLKNNVANLNEAMGGGKVLAQMSYENINALNQAGNLEAKEPYAVWLCTLVLNTRDEDRRAFELPVMQRKIRNWEANGIDIAFFLSIAEGLLGLPTDALRRPTLSYSDRVPNSQTVEPSDLTNEGPET